MGTEEDQARMPRQLSHSAANDGQTETGSSESGPQGPPGPAGNPRLVGKPGEAGCPGEVGNSRSDAVYCPCPPRTVQIQEEGGGSYPEAGGAQVPSPPTPGYMSNGALLPGAGGGQYPSSDYKKRLHKTIFQN